MKDFWILWTYLGNHCNSPFKYHGEDPQEAVDVLNSYFSEDFKEKATIYVFDCPPILTVRKGAKQG